MRRRASSTLALLLAGLNAHTVCESQFFAECHVKTAERLVHVDGGEPPT